MKKPKELPRVGEVIAVRLKKGFWGACWVARRGKVGDGLAHLGGHVVVAAADWFGQRQPTLADLPSPKVLHIDHQGYDLPAVFNVNDPLESGAYSVGRLEKAPPGGRAPWVSGWGRIAFLLEQQRLWNADRKASAAAYDRQKARWAARNERESKQEAKRVAARRKALTIAKLRRRRLLRAWDGAMPARRVAEGRAMLAKLLDALEAASEQPKAQVAAIRSCVRQFNHWNDAHGVIETAEREALYETLCDVAAAASLGDLSEDIDRWRDF